MRFGYMAAVLTALISGHAVAQQPAQKMPQAMPLKHEYAVAYSLEMQLKSQAKFCGSTPATHAQYQAALKEFYARNPGYVQAVRAKEKDPEFLKLKQGSGESMKRLESLTANAYKGKSAAQYCPNLANGLKQTSFNEAVKLSRQSEVQMRQRAAAGKK